MNRVFVCCGVLRPELEKVFAELAKDKGVAEERIYLEPVLHVNLDRLKQSLAGALSGAVGEGKRVLAIYGYLCHPEMEALVKGYGALVSTARNCIEMLLGEDMARLDAEARTFYLTPGWLKNWKQIFIEGLGWDSIDARQKFGLYDRILLLDTGVMPLDEEEILEFFDYTRVPVEIRRFKLQNLRYLVQKMLKEAEFHVDY
ncbi:hypothetical protein J2Z49_002826 [Desulfofundulus luciae]|uniref:DUF1638 domain-containing protein n=1 Tax=Desulfofundulus luciae TaxID=74702 RepID=A0ABU0B607_9FIRM|nr:DUF1638 domain-containing protein [Desulfofundulus luciae]MDQ0287695.1 hypothetical protein [Desulfofundulus luciae]